MSMKFNGNGLNVYITVDLICHPAPERLCCFSSRRECCQSWLQKKGSFLFSRCTSLKHALLGVTKRLVDVEFPMGRSFVPKKCEQCEQSGWATQCASRDVRNNLVETRISL